MHVHEAHKDQSGPEVQSANHTAFLLAKLKSLEFLLSDISLIAQATS